MGEEEIKIYQSGSEPTIVISQSEYSVEAEGETIKVEVSSNVNVEMTIPEDCDWIKEEETKAISTNTFYLNVAANNMPNQREAVITFSNEEQSLTEQVIIHQAGKYVKALYFTSNGEQSVNLINNGDNAPILQYSYNGNDWTDWDYSALSFGTKEAPILYIRGDNQDGFSSYQNFIYKYSQFSFSAEAKVQCGGSVMNLLQYSDSLDLFFMPNEYCFYHLFFGCTCLKTAPELPAVTLTDHCYYNMFENCTSLETAPELPADYLGYCCYVNMFRGCTSLKTAPKLPATNLTTLCYANMFSNCTSLVNAPELPAVSTTAYCYSNMFSGCTSLVNAPELPATTLTENCYYGMFSGCTSLVNAPELPATTLTDDCYPSMFSNCTSLVNAPELPATTLADDCYYGMFSGCTSLVNAPELPATTLAERCYFSMFGNCTSLISAPNLPATSLTNGCYAGMFMGCSSLETAPELPATNLIYDCYNSMFQDCTSLKTTPVLPAPFLVLYCYSFMFQNCTNLSTVICLAEDTSIYQHSWLEGVSSTGTFVKSPKCNSWWIGEGGIPEGWEVVDYTGE